MAVYRNLLCKEFFASIPDTNFITQLFEEGMKMGSTQVAVSAMEELLLRGDSDLVLYGLNSAFQNGDVKLGTSMCSMIARSLVEECRGVDPVLLGFGKALFRGEGGSGPSEWFATEGADKMSKKTPAP